METQLVIAENLGYLLKPDAEQLTVLSGEVSRLLHGLMQAIRKPGEQPTGS